MRPVSFPEVNVTLAKDQPEYLPLPAHRSADGVVTSCWQMTWRERLAMALHGKLWLVVLTYGRPLQPQLPLVCKNPFAPEKRPVVTTGRKSGPI